jgi:hypothetical protein
MDVFEKLIIFFMLALYLAIFVALTTSMFSLTSDGKEAHLAYITTVNTQPQDFRDESMDQRSPEEICEERAKMYSQQYCRRLKSSHYFESVEECIALNGESQYNLGYQKCWKEMRRKGVVTLW